MAKAKEEEKKLTMAERMAKIANNINKSDFGGENKDAVQILGSDDIMDIERFSSNHFAIDEALGGGIPKGRVIEIYGEESTGKTTFCLEAIVGFQKANPEGLCAIIDTEHALDKVYAKALGVDLDRVFIVQPDNAEQAMNILKTFIEDGVELCILDSVASMATQAELEGDLGDVHVAQLARLMSQSLRQLVSSINQKQSTVIFTNQTREKIGGYGNPTTTGGGKALKFYASIRMEIRRAGKEEVSGEMVGFQTKIKMVKNKTAPPFKEATILIRFGEGFDLISGLAVSLVDKKIITKKGGWFSHDETGLNIQGMAKLVTRLKEDEELKDYFEKILGGEENLTYGVKDAEMTQEEKDEAQGEEEPKEEKTSKRGRPKKSVLEV